MSTIYTSSTCAPCKKLKEDLASRGLKADFVLLDDLDRADYPESLRAVPTLITEDGTTIVGDAILEYLVLEDSE